MTPAPNALHALSDHVTKLVSETARSIVAIRAANTSASGFVWRPGLVVTASDALADDEKIEILPPDGGSASAELAGRDPTTDIALLRVAGSDALPAVKSEARPSLQPGEAVVFAGRRAEGVTSSLGTVSHASGAWTSRRGGRIDSLVRLDLRLDPRCEGGAVVDADGRLLGMAVFGPRRSVLLIPAATIDRVAATLDAKGSIKRGYLGVGLQPVRIDATIAKGLGLAKSHGSMVVSLDPDGPAKRAGFLLGDIILTWDGEPMPGVRSVHRRLGPDSTGQRVVLDIVRAGSASKLEVVVGEAP